MKLEVLKPIDLPIPNSGYLKKSKAITDFIKKEIDKSKKLFKKYNWPTIDVTRKSVEETAASVIKIYEIYKQND